MLYLPASFQLCLHALVLLPEFLRLQLNILDTRNHASPNAGLSQTLSCSAVLADHFTLTDGKPVHCRQVT